jgi:hypothetical protein
MLLSIGRGTEPAVLVSGNSRPADAVPGLIGRRGLNFPRDWARYCPVVVRGRSGSPSSRSSRPDRPLDHPLINHIAKM